MDKLIIIIIIILLLILFTFGILRIIGGGDKYNIVIFSGPSGSGKGTSIGILTEKYPNSFDFVVSCTTRQPRPKGNNFEVNGEDYYFISVDRFKEMINSNQFLEYQEVRPGVFYGTPIFDIMNKINNGKIIFIDITAKAAMIVKNKLKETNPKLKVLTVFINPKNREQLEYQLRHRGSEKSEDDIQKRLASADAELEYRNYFDVNIHNDSDLSGLKEKMNILSKIIFGEDELIPII